MQSRGAQVMGVDQYTSAHVFEDLPDGGRVVLDRADLADTAAISYEPIDRPRGGEVRIRSDDSVAVTAIHEFLEFQRQQHHSPSHQM